MTFFKRPIFVLLAISLLAGIFVLDDYGQSWDEPDIYRYGDYALDVYQYFWHPKDMPNFDTNLDFYGPAFFMIATIFSRGLTALVPAWIDIDAWHLVYFVTFLIGVYLLYLLAKRWMSEWAAFGVALIFLTQPLLWGHAFINPKDTPFMVFFAACVYFGLRMAEAPPRSSGQVLWILLAGILLGMTISFRVLGPLAGLIVLANAFLRDWRRTILISIPYLFVAGITAYLTWPFLWGAPIPNYLESLRLMSQFPFDAMVLFNGTLIPPDRIPRFYFPVMFALQLTEPLLLLFGFGFTLMILSLRKKELREPILIFAGWFLLPASAIVLMRSNLYDNARQLYFLFPPMFLAAGFGFDSVFNRITRPVYRGVFLLLTILPGLIAIARLHPYEYVYYNSLIGGVDGAVRRFETDYWGTSFKEAMGYVNSVAPEGARILILAGPNDIASRYARPDLEVVTEETDYSEEKLYDYVLLLTRKNVNEGRCKKSETVHTVGRGEAVFTFIKKLGPEGRCK
jgi:4-amino-4-deoxy-L-arabinose transferase-like glycosyltransferase